MVEGTQMTEVWEELQESQGFLIAWELVDSYKNLRKADSLPFPSKNVHKI